MAVQVRADMSSPWSMQSQEGFAPEPVHKAWTSTAKIIGVWQGNAARPAPAPVISVYDAVSGELGRNISLPRVEHQTAAPWERTHGDFRLANFALSPSHEMLAVTYADRDTYDCAFVWLVDLESGVVSCKAVIGSNAAGHISIAALSFSSDGKVLAVLDGIGGHLWVLSTSSMKYVMKTRLVGKQALPAPQHAAFILPQFRMVLFQGRSNDDHGGRMVFHHVAAVCANGKHAEQHLYASDAEDMEYLHRAGCAICNSLTLDNGSFSADGHLFVTLGSAGRRARQVMLEHWQMDYERRLCNPHAVIRLDLSPGSSGLLRTPNVDFDNDEVDPLQLHVAWHPLFRDRQLYVAAVEQSLCPGMMRRIHRTEHRTSMVHIIDGSGQAELKAIDLSEHGAIGPVSQLRWSPDGTMLAVRTLEHVHTVEFC